MATVLTGEEAKVVVLEVFSFWVMLKSKELDLGTLVEKKRRSMSKVELERIFS